MMKRTLIDLDSQLPQVTHSWVESDRTAQTHFLGLVVIAISVWTIGVPLAASSIQAGSNHAIGLFVSSCAVAVVLWIASFTTIGRFKAIAESLPAELADTASGRAFKTNPWFAFAATITAVHIGVLVGHGIVLLG